eukprot:5882378-Karenia_brevis.AAC.1
MVPGGTITNQHVPTLGDSSTTPTRDPYWSAICLGQGDQLQNWLGPIMMYTDGSGGPPTQDLRLRR